MEFRIAPMIMALMNLVFIIVVNPNLSSLVPLREVANIWRILVPFLLIMAMSIGSFLRHSYYSTAFKLVFFTIHTINIALAVYYIVAITQQHLG